MFDLKAFLNRSMAEIQAFFADDWAKRLHSKATDDTLTNTWRLDLALIMAGTLEVKKSEHFERYGSPNPAFCMMDYHFHLPYLNDDGLSEENRKKFEDILRDISGDNNEFFINDDTFKASYNSAKEDYFNHPIYFTKIYKEEGFFPPLPDTIRVVLTDENFEAVVECFKSLKSNDEATLKARLLKPPKPSDKDEEHFPQQWAIYEFFKLFQAKSDMWDEISETFWPSSNKRISAQQERNRLNNLKQLMSRFNLEDIHDKKNIELLRDIWKELRLPQLLIGPPGYSKIIENFSFFLDEYRKFLSAEFNKKKKESPDTSSDSDDVITIHEILEEISADRLSDDVDDFQASHVEMIDIPSLKKIPAYKNNILDRLNTYISLRENAGCNYSPGFFGLKKKFWFSSQKFTQEANVLLAKELRAKFKNDTLDASHLSTQGLKEIRDEQKGNIQCRERGRTSLNKIIRDLRKIYSEEKKSKCFSWGA